LATNFASLAIYRSFGRSKTNEMKAIFAVAFAALSTYSLASAQSPGSGSSGGSSSSVGQPSCGLDSGNCPSSAPCCSTYGQCGVGAYCLGGCDPRYSFDLTSCVPAPACKTQDYQMTSTDDISDIADYLGDPSRANWVSSGRPISYNGKSLLLTMAPETVGTLVSSAFYVWYGKISATFTTSRGQGVVTAFILMSDSHDEIDFEFVGADIQQAQTNYYAQGVPDCRFFSIVDDMLTIIDTHEANVSSANTNTETHTYTIDWGYDQLTWAVDGVVLRTLDRSDTWNSTHDRFDYPQTPSRVQLSLWPAGLPSNGNGTIKWAGGIIDWNSPYMNNGYYYAMFTDVSVECYDPPPGAQAGTGSRSYIYTDRAATNESIKLTDDLVILGSLMGTGDEPGSGATVVSGSTATATPASIPGEIGFSSGSNSNKGNDSTSGASPNSGASSFNQGGSGKTSAASSMLMEGFMRGGGSMLAVLIPLLGICSCL
jgi:beta-glucanase (GH16 family)